jgi:hypothetical protein
LAVEIQFFHDDVNVHSVLIGERPVMIGRAPGNDLILAAELISWHHAVIWIEGGRLWLKDLGSTNGTFVDGERAKAPQEFSLRARVTLGPSVELRFSGELPGAADMPRQLVVDDEEAGIRFPIPGDRFFIGSGSSCDLVLDDGPEEAAVITVHDDGEIWLGTDEDERSIEVGDTLLIEGRKLVLKLADLRGPTAIAERTRYPFRLTVDLQGATGPEALIEDLGAGVRCEIRSANRAVLLYILARRLQKDRDEEMIFTRQGWCNDEEVSSGVWGRNWKTHAGSHLHVLIHRLRKQLKGVKIDPWFIEKKRRHVRIRVEEIVIRD